MATHAPSPPSAHGAWLVLGTAVLLGAMLGGDPTKGTLALTLAAVFSFAGLNRLLFGLRNPQTHRAALVRGGIFLGLAAAAGVWTFTEVGFSRLAWLIPIALIFAVAQWRLQKKQRLFQLIGMVALSLALPAASIASGCPIAWPFFAVAIVFALHAGHATLRTHAHLMPKTRANAQWLAIVGGGLLLAMLATDGISLPVAVAVALGLAEPLAPNWRPQPAKAVGRKETVLLLLLPLAFLIESWLN
ncbi:MAG: hypothetical protein HN405_03525 [Planctomycetes bacterium]|nr:hypothetical protein [Planctomycetota bacterium]MBT4029777.1 hypothetical protein [Planctomycetota bacterium]MBT4559832.1 hypothetical protein [Planctomycetota bacterium]MBT5102390.1 hypothetical protein [Planctomycetota bacterium]MBT7012104.1 hypothetical protein [Planctomycetota bacterium]